MRRISVFGATGSIGCNTLDLIARQGGREAYDVVALTGGQNVALLAEQARRFGARFAVTSDPARLEDLSALLQGSDTRVLAGPAALVDVAGEATDWAMSAIVGAAGLEPTLALARSTGILALANKECMVCAGALVKQTARAAGSRILPVDSEHSAIFQCLVEPDRVPFARIILTASGGPFRTWSRARIEAATLHEALKHPNWSMGARITVDSASMFNKALEMIEAHELFDAAPERIEVVVHPQSIVHSMIEFEDGAVLAQLGVPDMRGPIGYALNYPERAPLPVERLDIVGLGRLDFEPPDTSRFPALALAREAMEIGGAAGAILNAAKEEALDAFIDGRIGFADMARIVAHVLDALAKEASGVQPGDGIEPILVLDARARGMSREKTAGMAASQVQVS